MKWMTQLAPYVGSEIELWIEDVSGEEKTKPQVIRVDHLEETEEGNLKCFLNPTQFVSIPIFADGRTRLETNEGKTCFVSEDTGAQLIYWLYVS